MNVSVEGGGDILLRDYEERSAPSMQTEMTFVV